MLMLSVDTLTKVCLPYLLRGSPFFMPPFLLCPRHLLSWLDKAKGHQPGWDSLVSRPSLAKIGLQEASVL